MLFFRNLLIAILSVGASLVSFEAALRLSGAKYECSFYESDPVLYTAFRPNAEGWETKEGENFVRINAHAMRDRERSVIAAPGTLRIVILGDSMVAAQQVPLDCTMSQLLERKLNAELGTQDHPVEVLNFAVGGYALAQEYLMLRERVWAFHPDIVLLFLSPNSVPSTSRLLHSITAPTPFFTLRDGELVLDAQSHAPENSSPAGRRRHAILANVMNRVRLLQLFRQAIANLPRELERLRTTYLKASAGAPRSDATTESPTDRIWLRPPSGHESERAWQVAEALLTAMADDAKRHGAEFWLSSIGLDIEDNPNPQERVAFLHSHEIVDFNYSHLRFEVFAETHRVAYVPLEPRVVTYGEHNQVALRGFFNSPPNEGHWNEVGNSAVAEVVGDNLTKRSVVLAALRQDVAKHRGTHGNISPIVSPLSKRGDGPWLSPHPHQSPLSSN
jgi:hypothetical protein